MNPEMVVRDTDQEYDAIVIGSGVTGGWAAKEFCERGLKTLMIERGRLVEHRKDYDLEGVPPWEQKFRGRVDAEYAEREHNVQRHCYAFNQATYRYFGNDKDLPFSTEDGTTFSWIRANQLGGKSLLWARQSYRFGDHDFAANKLDGEGLDWPLRYKDLSKWYSHVEIHAGISGSIDNLPQLPDSECLPPFEMSAPEIDFKQKIEALYSDRNVIIGRTANLSEPTTLHMSQGRVICQARNECDSGCSFGAAFSTQSSTLPAAASTGNLHIAPNSVVHSLIYDENRNRIRGVRVIDNDDLGEREYFGKIIFLCASTLGSTQILLNSTSKRFPNGLANSSGVLGHYLMDHNFNVRIGARIPGYENEYYSGRRPTALYIPNFQYKPSLYKKSYKRGYAWGARATRNGWESNLHKDGFGAEYKRQAAQAGDWHFEMWAQGEMLPRYENSVTLHPTLKDKWGIPQLHLDVRWSPNERLMMEDAARNGELMLRKAGFEDINAEVFDGPPGHAILVVGTARMGADAKESVFNGYNQSHDIPNLFCSDGATFCSSATQNPSLTFMAITARAVDYAVTEARNHRL